MTFIHSKSGYKEVDLRDFEDQENMWIKIKRQGLRFLQILRLRRERIVPEQGDRWLQ